MHMKKKVTIQDIADALGISRNTVSKAINNTEGLADATRERILQKAMEMGYKQFSYLGTLTAVAKPEPTTANESVFRGEIALLTTNFLGQSHFASLMLDRFQRELSQLGYILSTHRVDAENLDCLVDISDGSIDRVVLNHVLTQNVATPIRGNAQVLGQVTKL
jgi:LacI family transcriptional regulator